MSNMQRLKAVELRLAGMAIDSESEGQQAWPRGWWSERPWFRGLTRDQKRDFFDPDPFHDQTITEEEFEIQVGNSIVIQSGLAADMLQRGADLEPAQRIALEEVSHWKRPEWRRVLMVGLVRRSWRPHVLELNLERLGLSDYPERIRAATHLKLQEPPTP